MNRCMIIDDDVTTINRLSEYIAKIPQTELVGTSTHATEAIHKIKNHRPDLLFLDIDMPELSGLELIRLLDPGISVVFITNYREYALEAYQEHAIDYLLKPISFDKFYGCIKRVQTLIGPNSTSNHIFVSADKKGKQVKVLFDKVCYIEAVGNYIIIHSVDESVVTYLTLSEALEVFPSSQFTQIHRSFIVNTAEIAIVEKDEITLNGGKRLTLGGSYRDAFMKHVNATLVRSKRRN